MRAETELTARQADGPRVRRRLAFYVPGFDPASAHRYHRIYARHAERQSEVTGAPIEVGPAVERDPLTLAWPVVSGYGGERVQTDYRVMRWDDLVRARWTREGPALFLGVFRSLYIYARRGVLRFCREKSPLSLRVALMPAQGLVAYAVLFALLLAGVWGLSSLVVERAGGPWWTALLAPAAALALFTPGWKALQLLLPLSWLARSMICVADAVNGHGDIQARIAAFAQMLIEADREDEVDEILVIGHSLGCPLAASVVGRALRMDPELGRRDARIRLLTLGQMIPFYTLIIEAPDHLDDMRALADAAHIGWLDIAAPADPGSVGAAHPLTGAIDAPSPKRPVHRSPAFHRVLEKEHHARLKRHVLDYHSQYLFSTDMAGGYDYFRLTAGPDPLLADDARGPA